MWKEKYHLKRFKHETSLLASFKESPFRKVLEISLIIINPYLCHKFDTSNFYSIFLILITRLSLIKNRNRKSGKYKTLISRSGERNETKGRDKICEKCKNWQWDFSDIYRKARGQKVNTHNSLKRERLYVYSTWYYSTA